MNIQPVVLEGEHVRLEPLSLVHHAQLCTIGLDEDLLRWTESYITTPDGLRAYIETALQWQAQGTALPFAVVSKAAGRAIGSTRFANIDRANRRVEIGWTWYGREYQRTAVNTESKYLLLRHAFETLGCIRVELKTDALNERSRRAILRIGAREEGVFRHHMILPSGRVRDTVYFSIIDDEWPRVKVDLLVKLGRSAGGPGRGSGDAARVDGKS
jgi:RimJ/RimL family protein N-acetyltransferase